MDATTRLKLLGGNEIPVIGLGTWQLSKDPADIVQQALELGYRMIDTSGDYGSQPGVGEGVRLSGLSREEVYVVTKVEEDDDAYEATKRNLDELGLDYADLMLIHRPPKHGAGEHLWAGLIRARVEGLVHDIGVSSYSIEQMTRLYDGSGVIPAINQIEWSPFGWSPEMLDFCNAEHIVIQAYSPLTHAERLDDRTLRDLAGIYGKSPAQILLRWDLQHGVVPIPKADERPHLEQNTEVFDFELAEGDMATLNELNEQYSALGERIAYA
jgi:2,5-diketo-D-gluconate reductase A